MVNNLRLQNFRSYKDDSFEFSPRVNIIVGPNASGKTNLLEAILMSCTGSSYRGRDQEVIMFSKSWAKLDADTAFNKRTVKIENLGGNKTLKTMIINGETIKRITGQKKLPVVLFEPNHIRLFHNGPDGRREYLDDLIERLQPGFGLIRRQYKRALAQRNHLLKNNHQGALQSQIFAWDVRLSELGGQIVVARQDTIKIIRADLEAVYCKLSVSKSKLGMTYMSRLPSSQYSSAMLRCLQDSLGIDRERGFTGYGPHRDDVSVNIDGHAIRHSASRGEVRSVVLSLKVIELGLVARANDLTPILLMDDVFSELDGARRLALTEVIQDHQIFITTTDADVVVSKFMKKANVIAMNVAMKH